MNEENLPNTVLWDTIGLKVVFKCWAEPPVNGGAIFGKYHPAILEITYNGETTESRELLDYKTLEHFDDSRFFQKYPVE